MKKIVVIGNSASGKSTLSMKIKELTNIPVFHLDKILWKKGWERTPEDEFRAKQTEILNQDKWIIDGVAYKSTIEERFSSSDTIIYLDTPLEICKERAKTRMEEDLIRPNPYVNEGCPYPLELIKEQNKVIERFHNEYRKYSLNLLEKFKDSKEVYHLIDEEDVKKFLEKINLKNNFI